jgi:hypothetical protein
MNKEIESFISNEREIALYKLEMLQALSGKRYKERLILKEKEFINYKFEDLNIDSLSEMRKAVMLFRVDKASFSLKYEKKDIREAGAPASLKNISDLNSKILYLTDLFLDIVNIHIQKLNFVDNEYLKGYYKNKYCYASIEEVLSEEGVIAAKHRARIQIMLFSLARYIFDTTKKVSKKIESGDLTVAEFLKESKVLDTIFDNYYSNIFCYYNESIEQLPDILKDSRGENRFIGSIYPLKNICNLKDEPFVFRRYLDKDRDILSKTGRPIKKKYTARAYSLDTGISRVGNENIELLYCDLYSSRGNCITGILDKSFYNLSSGSEYTKALSTKPIWEIRESELSEELKREVFKLIGTESVPMNDSILSKDSSVINLINNNCTGTLEIDKSISKILVAATRSESEKIVEAKKYIDLLINSLNKEYMNNFTYSTSVDLKSAKDRKTKVREIIGRIFNEQR